MASAREKFSDLRILCESCHGAIRQRIFGAEQEPFRTCEVCGQSWKGRGGWVNTRCDGKRAHTEQESMAGYHKINFGNICLPKPSHCEPCRTRTRLTAGTPMAAASGFDTLSGY